MSDTEAPAALPEESEFYKAAEAEQRQEQPEPPPIPQLFDADQRTLLNRAAVYYRLAARTIEAMAVSAQPQLRDSYRRGAERFVAEAGEIYAEVVGGDV